MTSLETSSSRCLDLHDSASSQTSKATMQLYTTIKNVVVTVLCVVPHTTMQPAAICSCMFCSQRMHVRTAIKPSCHSTLSALLSQTPPWRAHRFDEVLLTLPIHLQCHAVGQCRALVPPSPC